MFEPHTEWINKGKIELGHRLLITSTKHDITVDYKIMKNTTDANEVEPLIDRLEANIGLDKITSMSFVKGFS